MACNADGIIVFLSALSLTGCFYEKDNPDRSSPPPFRQRE